MPRVNFVKKARKDIKGWGDEILVHKGESYYWWKFRYGGKRISKVYPKRSQLTQSEFWSQAYDILDRLTELDGYEPEDLRSEAESLAQELRDLGQEQEDKRSNMPESLQYGATGELLEERYNACEEVADEIESIDFDYEEPSREEAAEQIDFEEDDTDEIKEQKIDDWLEEHKSSWMEDKAQELSSIDLNCG